MNYAELLRRRRRRRALLACLLLLGSFVSSGLLVLGSGAGTRPAAAASTPGAIRPQTDDAVPARNVTMFGASPGEAGNEVWGIGTSHGATTIVHYVTGAGWSVAAGPLSSSGKPLEGFELDQPEPGKYAQPSPLAGTVTENGSAVLLGTVPGASKTERREVVLARNPGGAFQEVSGEEVSLSSEEELFGQNRAPLVAALEEPGGKAGALIVPVVEHGGSKVESSVLHWDGTAWSSEPIEIPAASSKEFQVLAIGAASGSDAWLLASLSSSYPQGSVGLFRRHVEGEKATWQPVSVDGSEPGGPVTVPVGSENETFTIAGATQSQIITATTEGVWLDGLRADTDASTTIYVKPTGEGEAAVKRAWCVPPAGKAPACAGTLPETLPKSGGRSYAWADPSEPYGRRVLSGLPVGQSLRLEGSEFVVQPALGGTPHHDVGGVYGSAFASDREGWLGQELLPVHLTEEAPQNHLTPWPVPFRKALLAIAPAPGQPVGALASEALAVGDNGEVARYRGAKAGWVPESLLGPGGKFETVRLRAVAWPRANRAYAVGDFSGNAQSQMWVWRGETGLWEADPATPENFRGNLLGIAFDPEEPSRGYAVGEEGSLLGYGKTWTQEALPAEPACAPIHAGNAEEIKRCSTWSDVTFTSIAFAGSEAIAAYRILPSTASEQYRGGLLVNSGGGWHVDAGAAAVLGEDTPYAVAALPDGGAAFSASGLIEGSLIFERQGAGASWQPTATPFPGRTAGSLSLFREGGALRAVATGVVPDTARIESEANVPVGQPPELLRPYPIESSPEQGVLRQTASGWNDEEHELNNAKEVPGEYTYYDTPYSPDPVAAVLVSESGGEGWAVGGTIDNAGHALLDTADVERYRGAEGQPPEGFGQASVPEVDSKDALFAVGGDAQCEAPCATMSDAGIGPDRWLSNALGVAKRIGAHAFFDTGKRVTSGATAGPATVPVPWEAEEDRYRDVLGALEQPGVFSAYPTASATDDEPTGARTEQAFVNAFGSLLGLEAGCLTGCGFYTAEIPGKPATLAVELDEVGGVGGGELEKLRSALQTSDANVIVLGSENLAQLDREHGQLGTWFGEVTQALVEAVVPKKKTVTYFFDAPEVNVEEPLSSGGKSISSYGSGTLGYENFTKEEGTTFDGASGFMLVEAGEPSSEPHVRLIPNIEELAIEAQQGTLLRRSSAAYFQGLGRRPRSGNRAHNGETEAETDPYIQLPGNCLEKCGQFPQPEYTFESSNPSVGRFVEPADEASRSLTPKLVGGEVHEDKHSALFCALNKGETTITLTSGGLKAQLHVQVQAGSVRRPCGTTPANEKPKETQTPAPAPAPSPTPATAAPTSPPPIPLPAPPATPAAPIAAKPPAPQPFFINSALPAFIPPFLPPPVPTPARPTPPSGTSAVTSPVEAPEKQEEEEAAPESVSNEAVAYQSHEHEPTSPYLLGLIVLAAFAGASVRRRPGRGRREARIAPATVNTMRAQRRNSRRRPW